MSLKTIKLYVHIQFDPINNNHNYEKPKNLKKFKITRGFLPPLYMIMELRWGLPVAGDSRGRSPELVGGRVW